MNSKPSALTSLTVSRGGDDILLLRVVVVVLLLLLERWLYD